MKILLFGEFSGLHNNLKDGLRELGHDVTLASGSDGFKQLPNDVNLDSSLSGIIGKLDARAKPFLNLPKLSGFDVVQIINPFWPNAKMFPKEFFYKMLKKLNGKFFILGAGSDAFYWKYSRERLEFGPFEDNLKYDLKTNKYYMEEDSAFQYNKRIVEASDGLIPILYEYEIGYRDCHKRLNTIPLPMNTKAIEFSDNVPSSRIAIFHALTRYGFKGTRHVEEAFEVLNKKYPNDLDCYIDGHRPINEYLGLMRKANVILDQVNSPSIAMNGLYALAMGKVVMGGAEEKGLKSLGIDKSPVIGLKPDKDVIIDRIKRLLDDRESIQSLGIAGREFVKEHHCHIKIAKRYIETWTGE